MGSKDTENFTKTKHFKWNGIRLGREGRKGLSHKVKKMEISDGLNKDGK